MDKKTRQQIALFRHGLIGDLVHRKVGERGLYALLRDKAERVYEIPGAFARMHSASSHRSACVDAASRPSSFWATPRNPSTAHSCAISPTPSPGSTESKQAKPMSRLQPKTPSQRTACARQSAMPSWPPTWSSPNFPVKSPYGSPGSVKLLVPPTCFWGGTRFEVPRFS